jgi:hypothetical protein
MCYNMYFTLIMPYKKSKHVSLNVIYLVVLTVSLPNGYMEAQQDVKAQNGVLLFRQRNAYVNERSVLNVA